MRLQRHLRAVGIRSAVVAPLIGVAALAAPIVLAGVVFAAPSTTPAVATPAVAAVAAAPSGTATTEVDNDAGTLHLAVTPSKRLPAGASSITVTGSGYSDDGDLWIAVCEDGSAPEALDACLGGPIPDFNGSSAWGIVSDDPIGYAGPVSTNWVDGDSFEIILHLMGAAGSDADCLTSSCFVFTRSADPNDRSQDAKVRVKFAKPPAPPKTTAPPSTETVGAVPVTVQPDVLESASVAIGEKQSVTFSGFEPGEKVDVTVYSDPLVLPTVNAGDDGVVDITFEVTEELGTGAHILEAIGRESARTGIVSFTVTPAVAGTEETDLTTEITVTETPSADVEDTLADDMAGAADDGAAGDGDLSQQDLDDAGAADDGVVDDESAAGSETTADSGTGSSLVWLWITLIVLVVVGGAVMAMVLWARRGQHQRPIHQEPWRDPNAPLLAGSTRPGETPGAPSGLIGPGGAAPGGGVPGARVGGHYQPTQPGMPRPDAGQQGVGQQGVGQQGPGQPHTVLPGLGDPATPPADETPTVLFSHGTDTEYSQWAQHRSQAGPGQNPPGQNPAGQQHPGQQAPGQHPASPADTGPATQQWTPNFDDEDQ